MLMGFENFAASLIDNERFAADVIGRIAEIQLDAVGRVLSLPHVGGVWIVDDIASTAGPLVSPAILRSRLFPFYRRLAKRCHERNLLVFMHTDGDLTSLMDDLIELGLDGLHPIDRILFKSPGKRR
jgi:uroporphyrinogen decarboxylase